VAYARSLRTPHRLYNSRSVESQMSCQFLPSMYCAGESQYLAHAISAGWLPGSRRVTPQARQRSTGYCRTGWTASYVPLVRHCRRRYNSRWVWAWVICSYSKYTTVYTHCQVSGSEKYKKADWLQTFWHLL
jgi:hypothetical protein